jgi:hypothetical protein
MGSPMCRITRFHLFCVGCLCGVSLLGLGFSLIKQTNTAFIVAVEYSHMFGLWILLASQLVGQALNGLSSRELACFRPTNLYSDAPVALTYRRMVFQRQDPMFPKLFSVLTAGVSVRKWSWKDVPINEHLEKAEKLSELEEQQYIKNNTYSKNPIYCLLLALPYVLLFCDVGGARATLFSFSSWMWLVDLCLVLALWFYVANSLAKHFHLSLVVVFVLGVMFGLATWFSMLGQTFTLLLLVGLACTYDKSWYRNSFLPFFMASGVFAGLCGRIAALLGHPGLGGGMIIFAISMWLYSAGVTKIATSGIRWCDGNYLKELIVRNKYIHGSLSPLQSLVLKLPNWLRILGMAMGLCLELAAPLMWWQLSYYLACFLVFLVATTIIIGVPFRIFAFLPSYSRSEMESK